MGIVDELESGVRQVADAVGRSVVGVAGARSAGSGIVIGPGRVVTNAHNLRRGTVTVTFADGRTAEGRAAGVDVDGDVAVLDVDTADAPALSWSENNGTPRIGDAVFALANPGGRGLRVTFGLVSGTERSFRGPRGRRISGSIEHTAPLLPGSSGGPVVDRSGRLLGINTNRLGEGFYLALPADPALRERIDALGRGQTPSSLRLGIAVAPAYVARGMRRAVGLDEIDGLLVRGVEEGGPADRAGIAEGDLIVAVGDRQIATADDLFEVLAASTDSLELKLVRGTEERTVTVTPEGSEK
ncbi:MAG: S1C family serine protease [Actinomycetota bacterium]